LADDDPKLPGHRDRAANMNNNLSLVLRRLGRPAEARDHAERAVAAREELIKAEPEAAYRGDLAENYLNRGLSRRALGDLAGAASDVHRALGLWNALPSWRVEEWFEAACAHAALAGLAGQGGSSVPATEAASEAEAAMALLHEAVARGYRKINDF